MFQDGLPDGPAECGIDVQCRPRATQDARRLAGRAVGALARHHLGEGLFDLLHVLRVSDDHNLLAELARWQNGRPKPPGLFPDG
jgi:hypothetical protein